MAQDLQYFAVTCPAGTPITAPLLSGIAMGPRTVRRIDWRVPNGPMGVMGFLLLVKGGVVLPVAGKAQYVVANQEQGSWDLEDYPDSGDWQCQMYNTGASPHTVYLTFHVDLPARAPALAPLHDFTAPPFGTDLSMAGPPVAGGG